jgi:hypothetical protein
MPCSVALFYCLFSDAALIAGPALSFLSIILVYILSYTRKPGLLQQKASKPLLSGTAPGYCG